MQWEEYLLMWVMWALAELGWAAWTPEGFASFIVGLSD